MTGVLAKGMSLDRTRWKLKLCDDDGFHFKICEPKIDPDSEFRDDLAYHLPKISRLVALDECRIKTEDNASIVKVRPSNAVTA